MSTTNFRRSRSHTKSFEELLCSLSLLGGFQQQQLICFLAIDILLCIIAFDGNSLILVALHMESSLHPPSKLLYRCLATIDLLVGLVAQPLHALSWMSVVQEQWILCQNARDAAYITRSRQLKKHFAELGLPRVVLQTFKADLLSHDYWIKRNKSLNRIVAQAVVNSLYTSENNLTTD